MCKKAPLRSLSCDINHFRVSFAEGKANFEGGWVARGPTWRYDVNACAAFRYVNDLDRKSSGGSDKA